MVIATSVLSSLRRTECPPFLAALKLWLARNLRDKPPKSTATIRAMWKHLRAAVVIGDKSGPYSHHKQNDKATCRCLSAWTDKQCKVLQQYYRNFYICTPLENILHCMCDWLFSLGGTMTFFFFMLHILLLEKKQQAPRHFVIGCLLWWIPPYVMPARAFRVFK